MSEEIELKCDKNPIFNGIKDDVYPPQWNIIATNVPSVKETESERVITEINDGVAIINNQNCAASELNSKTNFNEHNDDEEEEEEIKIIVSGHSNNNGAKIKHEHLNNNNNNIINNNIHNKTKRKRRRRKSKRSNNPLSYGKTTHWKFQVPKAHENRRNNKKHNMISMIGKPLVPYNTNKFLMEEHMPEVTITGRTRDSSFSVDSEDNYFYSLPEEEEDFLTKEFSSVYEDARAERLENMSKTQLIQEYLQLESNFEQLNRRYNSRLRDEDPSVESLNKIQILEEQIKKLTSDNLDLRRKIEYPKRKPLLAHQDDRMCSNTDSSEDSESDSTSSSSTSNSRNISISSSISGAGITVDDYTMRLNVNNDNHNTTDYPVINHLHQNGFRTPPISPSNNIPLSPQQIQIGNSVN